MECSRTTLKLRFVSVLWTYNIAFEFIKVNVSPPSRLVINEPDTRMLPNQVLHVPALTIHRLLIITNLGPDNL